MEAQFRRVVQPLQVSCTPRTCLDQSRHGSIDLVLKNLKINARRLQTALGVHAGEYILLERLYYKGKNQHRSALFWRRVGEIRRYSDRLSGMGIDTLVNTLRCSFYDEDAHKDSKLLKRPWTRFPDVRSIASVLERLTACSALLEKLHERLLYAYRSFTLAMQSGAFVQLILTLVAITSRMDAIVLELQEALAASSDVLKTAHCILFPVLTDQLPHGIGQLPDSDATNLCEGLGSIIRSAQSSVVEPLPVNETISVALVPPSGLPVRVEPVSRVVIKRKADIVSPATLTASVKKRADVEHSKKRQKSNVEKDEIDAIFGF